MLILTERDIATGERRQKQFLEELTRAHDRIGFTVKGALEWLLLFSQRDLSDLSSGDWSNLQYEMLAFGRYGAPVKKRGVWTRQGLLSPLSLVFTPTALPTMKRVRVFQGLVHKAVEGILSKCSLVFEPKALQLVLYPSRDPKPTWDMVSASEVSEAALEYALVHLLAQGADRLRRCPRCQKLFLADRVSQEFCSRKCQTQVASYQYRVRKGLITGRRRGRPRKAEERIQGKGTKRREGSHGKTRAKG